MSDNKYPEVPPGYSISYPLALFIPLFAIFLFFLTPNVNTGDGGELITASYFLGTAHPSSYPLYLMVGKTFALLPFGNIAFRVALISAICSALCLTLIYRFMLELTSSKTASFFTMATLLVSYSYFTQSVVAKFYPLNLLLILLIFAIWARRLLESHKNMDENTAVYLTCFLLGLTTANHHTGIIMLGPVAAAWLFLRRRLSFSFKTISSGFASLLTGFAVNIYLFARGGYENFFTAVNVTDFRSFYQIVTRQAYKGSGTISAAAQSFHNLAAYWSGLVNFVSILTANFSIFSYLLFLTGCFYLFRKNHRLFMFAVLGLALYGPFLAKITLASKTVSETEFYLAAHQYFLPAIALFAIIAGTGFHQITEWLKTTRLELVRKMLPVIAAFPLVFLVSRATDSNFRSNFVPYQVAKDTYSTLPPSCVIITFGDNASYQGWYLKLVGKYRDDVCQLSSAAQRKILWGFQGCSRRIYDGIFPMLYSYQFSEIVPLMLKHRFYGTDPIKEDSAYKDYMYSNVFSTNYLYFPKSEFIENISDRGRRIDNFIFEKQLITDKLVNYSPCRTHLTDDLFTRQLCSSYVIHLTNMARCYSGQSYKRTGETVEVKIIDMKTGYLQPLYKVDVTERNRPYLELSTDIEEFNQWKIFYLRREKE